jgi:hypothetical protein
VHEEFAEHHYHRLICRHDENKSEIGIAETSAPVTGFQFPEKINSSPLFPFSQLQAGATRYRGRSVFNLMTSRGYYILQTIIMRFFIALLHLKP